jgi:hypothetical protein
MFRIKVYLAAIGAFIAALLGAYWRGRGDAAGAENERKLEEYEETRKRMDSVNIDDADLGRDWLRNRNK